MVLTYRHELNTLRPQFWVLEDPPSQAGTPALVLQPLTPIEQTVTGVIDPTGCSRNGLRLRPTNNAVPSPWSPP
jgi:hypothetical protein